MSHALAFVLAAVAVIVVIHIVADRTGLPAAALLTVAGVTYAALPGPNITLDPDVVLTFVIPPLLYSAAISSSLLAIRRNLRVIISLSVALVLVTALLTGVGFALLVPGVGLAAGVALGAAVAPTDPVAALAIGRRAGLPPRLITVIEGEGLLNDATALTTLTVAVVAVSEGFSFGSTALRFVLSAAGGVLVGVVVAAAVRLLRSVVDDPILINSISLATPFVAYLLGDELQVSGVLAVVVAGLLISHDTPRATSGASRLQTAAVWRLVDFLLEGFVFLLIGQQLAPAMQSLQSYSTATIVAAVAVSVGVVLVVRVLWLVLTQLLPRALHTRLGGENVDDDRRLGPAEVLVLSWAGTRGVITLAAVATLPLVTETGASFPARDLLVFCAFVVVLVTLVGQGLTFSPLVRATGLRAGEADAAVTRNEARAAAVQAALSRLDQLEAEGETSEEALRALRGSLRQRSERYRRRLDVLARSEDGQMPFSAGYESALRARRAVIDAQRDELLRWRDEGRLPDSGLRILEHELDLEEHMLPTRDH